MKAVKLWMPILGEDVRPTTVPFLAHPGPDRVGRGVVHPIDYFGLYFPDSLLHTIVRETNRYAKHWIDTHQQFLRDHPKSRVHLWIKQGHTNRQEMRVFLSITFNMGLIKKSTIESYWNVVHRSQDTPWFRAVMNRDRFQLLCKFIHFADNTQLPGVDEQQFKLFKLQPLINHFTKVFQRYYQPKQDISIDESMIGYRGKTPHLRQYMPNKHHSRFGIKLWCLCESDSGYTCHFEVYKGAADPRDGGAEGMTFNLCVRLLREANLLRLGYHLGLDNYFSSPKLFFHLFDKQTTATGTVRSNRKGLPSQVKQAKPSNKQTCERRKGNLLCVAYTDGAKRPLLLSTFCKGGFSNTINKRNEVVRKPRVVIKYNSSMGGVDVSDARLYRYLAERRTMKWTTKVAFALFGRALLNSYILYDAHTTVRPKMSRYLYMVSIIEALSENARPAKAPKSRRRSKAQLAAARALPPPPIAAPAHEVQAQESNCLLEKLPTGKKRDCVNNHPKRVRSSYQCKECNVGICATCFVPYHKKKKILLSFKFTFFLFA